ncbi:APC family permease [Demequina muriae]|uniref:APC family permease n=1 Tax=Demequina muriae TaxID=3051664 RepID=A0ABT8GFU5_9MICO|nr:APC family permease [Demequina sp. EGI L300058]MDN4480295.1 APC family permease [Demequina sp. EGI L300058]
MADSYREGSLSLRGAVAMGTGVMVGAGIFALTGQVAALAGPLFPLAFLTAAGVAGLGAYTYVKMTRANPSSGGVAMILTQAYGRTAVAAGSAMLMALSMVLNQALVARTFGTYLTVPFGDAAGWIVPVLAVAVIAGAVAINLARNEAIGWMQTVGAVVKIGGIGLLAIAALAASGWSYEAGSEGLTAGTSVAGFIAATGLGVLAYKGFTTITNSGGELENPSRNVGRAIVISLVLCAVVYVIVAIGAGSSLSVDEIVEAQDYSLAEAARPALGQWGMWATVVVAVVACVTGLISSMFAVSRMLTMVTDMRMIPHRHFGMPGDVRHHMLVYLGVVAAVLAVALDMGQIAAVGIIFYLVMDMVIHWGVLRRLRHDVEAKAWVLVSALIADAVVLTAFAVVRGQEAPWVIEGAFAGVGLVYALEAWYLRTHPEQDDEQDHETSSSDESGRS